MLHKQKLFVFPTSRAIRNFISLHKDENKLLPFILTIDEFFKKSTSIKNKKYIDEEEKLLFLNQAIKDIDISKLGISKNFTKFLKQSDYIYRFFLELASEKVEIDDIKTYDTYDFYYEHLKILKQIQKKYLLILEENSCVDKINFHKYYEINKNFLDKFSEIEILFEGYFTKVEYEIIERISKEINLSINFYSNEYNQKSLEKFNSLNEQFDLDYKYKVNISKNSIEEKTYITPYLNNLEIKGFSSRINQIAYIKSTIVKNIHMGIEPSKIVLVLPDEGFSSLLELFDNEKYFNYAMGKSINKYFLYQTCLGIYNYITQDEIKNLKNIEYLSLEKEFIDSKIKGKWNKSISKEDFKEISDFIKSFEKNSEILEKFEEMLYKFNILIFSSNQNILLKDIYKIFLQKIQKIKLDDVNSGKITVMGLLETRASSFDSVIICDFNESFIPKISVKDKFLSTKIKEKTHLPTSQDREMLQKYYYKRLIESCKNVFISYESSQTNQISRFSNELFKDFKDYNIYDNSYKHILYNNHHIHHYDEEIICKIDLTKMSWSASSLKTFLLCKRKFYLQYIMKLGEHSLSLKPKSYELGDIIHKVLQKYYDKKNTLTLFTYERIEDLLNEYKSKNPFLILDIEIWKRKLYDFVKYEEDRLRNKSILHLEKKFEIKFEGLRLKGVIDRIDKDKDFYELIDYKTSSSLKVDTFKSSEKSIDFQLEFYYLAIQELFNTSNIKAFYYDLNNLKLLEEIALDKKLELLTQKFDEIKELSKNEISFSKCVEKSNCQFCPYLTICNRD